MMMMMMNQPTKETKQTYYFYVYLEQAYRKCFIYINVDL
jgi:hypothetical protein